MSPDLIRCSRCGLLLDAESFSPTMRVNGSWCRACHAAYAYERYVPHPIARPTVAQRLDGLRLELESGCWLSKGHHTSKGLPMIYLDGHDRSLSRTAWVLEHGPVADDDEVRRTCATRGCWRPDHHEVRPRKRTRRVWSGAIR